MENDAAGDAGGAAGLDGHGPLQQEGVLGVNACRVACAGEEERRAATEGIDGEEDAAARPEGGPQLPMMMALSPDGMQLDHAEMQAEYAGIDGAMGGQEYIAFASPSAETNPRGQLPGSPQGQALRWRGGSCIRHVQSDLLTSSQHFEEPHDPAFRCQRLGCCLKFTCWRHGWHPSFAYWLRSPSAPLPVRHGLQAEVNAYLSSSAGKPYKMLQMQEYA